MFHVKHSIGIVSRETFESRTLFEKRVLDPQKLLLKKAG